MCALHQAANIYYRLAEPVCHYPMALWHTPAAVYSSGSRDAPQVAEAAARLFQHPRCCLDKSLTCKVIDSCGSFHAFLRSSALDCLLQNAADVTTCNLDLERMQARNRADNRLSRGRAAPRLFTSSAISVWSIEHQRLGGQCPRSNFTIADWISRKVPVVAAKRAWRGVRESHLSGFPLYWQWVCQKWQAGTMTRVARRRRVRGRQNPVRKVYLKQPWSRWIAYRRRHLEKWANDDELRAHWAQRVPQELHMRQFARQVDVEVEQRVGLQDDDTLWGCGDKSAPIRFAVLAETVNRLGDTQTIASHPCFGRIVGPTSLARRLAKAHDMRSTVSDPALPGPLPQLVVEQPCWQKHPGLCMTKDADVFDVVTHVQANLNTLFSGYLVKRPA
jgi:hypothetical protein